MEQRRTRYQNTEKKGKNILNIVFSLLLVLLLLLIPFYLVPKGREIYYNYQYPLKFEQLVTKYAEKNNLEPSLVYAVINCESSFDPLAESYVPARGLMQITEDTFDWLSTKITDVDTSHYTYDDLFDPEINIMYGTFFLRYLMNELGELRNVIAAYHAGINAVKRWLLDPDFSSDTTSLHTIPYPTTNEYVDKVLKTKEVYEAIYEV